MFYTIRKQDEELTNLPEIMPLASIFKSQNRETDLNSAQYVELYQDENDISSLKPNEKMPTPHRTNSYMKSTISAFLGALTTLFVIWIIHIIHPQTLNSSLFTTSTSTIESSAYESCGTTPAEARAAGCVFEYMTFNWVPARCFDFELVSSEYNTSHASHTPYPWSYKPLTDDPLDPNRVSEADMLSGEFDGLYGSNDYHRTHCTFAWKKFHRAVLSGGPIDTYLSDYEHTKHCEMMLMMLSDEDRTRTRVKYAMCPIV